MVNISYFVLSFFLLDYKQVEKLVFKLCNHVRLLAGQLSLDDGVTLYLFQFLRVMNEKNMKFNGPKKS